MSDGRVRLMLVAYVHAPSPGLPDPDEMPWPDASVRTLDLSVAPADQPPPHGVTMLSLSDTCQRDALRAAFLAFLSDWPAQLIEGASFDERFPDPVGGSLWWAGPGLERVVHRMPFVGIRTAWTCCRAVEKVGATDVWLHADDARVVSAFVSWARRRGVSVRLAAGSPEPIEDTRAGRWRWLLKGMALAALLALGRGVRSAIARWAQRSWRSDPPRTNRPTVAMTTVCPRHFQRTREALGNWYWRDLRDALTRLAPGLGQVLVPYTAWSAPGRKVRDVAHQSWWLLPDVSDVVTPLRESHWLPRATLSAAGRQVRAMIRYARLESGEAFARSLEFEGMDVSAFYLPLLRKALLRQAPRELKALEAVRCLRKAGDVRALLVTEEFYGTAQPFLVAARELGIPTIGVQHGTIYSMHLMYTVPRGQVRLAPMPDLFAAYGRQAAEVVETAGAYPAHRIRVVGSPRLDRWVIDPPDGSSARRRLGLNGTERVIFVATQNFAWFPRAAEAVFRAAADRPDWHICLKTHPIDVPLAVYRDIARRVGCHGATFYDDRFDDLLAACDVLVSGSSTTVLEAIAMGKATVSVNFSGLEEGYPYVADEGALPGRDRGEVERSLAKALDPTDRENLASRRRRFLERHLGPTATGKGAETLARLILSLPSVPTTCGSEQNRAHSASQTPAQ